MKGQTTAGLWGTAKRSVTHNFILV